MKKNENKKILLIEDNLGDARLIIELFNEFLPGCSIVHKIRAEDSVEYLLNTDSLPNLIILDLKLNGMNGFECLKELKYNRDTLIIPIVVLSSSAMEEDIYKAYDFYANCYIRKSISLNEFQRIINSIIDFWFNTALLPVK
ncbi:MAG: response regulator [Melioribacteraceae bacterium]